MSLKPARYLLMSAMALACICAALAWYNYRVDRWGVFAADFRSFHERIQINKLYLKSSYLLSTDLDYDCYLFGSSRLAAVDASRFGEHCYNFTHSGGTAVDHLAAIKLLLANGKPVRRVVIALDDLSYNEDPDAAQYQPLRRPYPNNAWQALGFVNLFLMRPPELADLGLFSGARPKLDTPRFIVDPNLDTERIRRHYRKFFDNPRWNDRRFRRLDGMAESDTYYGERSIDALRELKAIARENDIQLGFFFMPLHYKTYLGRHYPFYYRFKQSIAELFPFRDFSGLNRYTADNRYWRETSHFSATLGDVIAGEMLGEVDTDTAISRRVDAQTLPALEQSQVAVDAGYLPLLARRETLLSVPDRIVDWWFDAGLLGARALRSRPPPGRGYLDPLAAGKVEFDREDDGEARSGVLALELRRGDYFLLQYDFDSTWPEWLTWRLAQDRQAYGAPQLRFRQRVEPGLNRGSYLGYASVDKPVLRVNLGGGDLDYQWRGLRLYRLQLDANARGVLASFDDVQSRAQGGES